MNNQQSSSISLGKDQNIIDLNKNNENINNINEKNINENEIFSIEKENKIKKSKKEKNKNNNSINFSSEEDSSENFELSEEKKGKLSLIHRKRQKSKKSFNDNENNNNNMETIINIPEFISNMNSNNITNILNSDMILIILEICLNSFQFGITEDNSSRAFWEEISKKEILYPITKLFKAETLRKYWRTIRNINKPKKIINAVKEYKEKINNENIKLLSSINIICDYILFPKKGIDYFINKYCSKYINKTNKKVMNVKDMTIDEQIDELIHGFEEAFPLKTKNEIIDKLYQNNFDVKNTYLVLKDEINFGFLSFDKKDDELVLDKNIDDEKYREFALRKGHINIVKRRKFLEGNEMIIDNK